MTRPLPKSVLVCGMRYSVDEVPQSEIPDRYGDCGGHDLRIRIARELAPERKLWAYRHEVAHAALEDSGVLEILKANVPPSRLEDIEEALIRTFLPAYLAALGVR